MIYVKENPKQNEHYRNFYFFERFKFIKNAKFTPLNEDSAKLIANSQFVATISSTAGYEALCMKKSVLCFGNAWYKNFEGVFRWQNNFDFNLIKNYKLDYDKLKNDFNKLLSKMPRAVIDKDYLPHTNLSKSQCITNIKNLIKFAIKQM